VNAGQDAYSAGNLSTAFMIVGALGVGAGLTLWLTAPHAARETTSAQLSVGPGSLQLRGDF
jgi:hypothetical protein